MVPLTGAKATTLAEIPVVEIVPEVEARVRGQHQRWCQAPIRRVR